MAAKTNPIILEYVRGLSIDIQGECSKIMQYCQNGQLQLNAFLPFICENFINIHSSLVTAINTLVDKFFNMMSINNTKIEKNLVESFALLNSLLPLLGYNKIKSLYKIIEQKKPNTMEELHSIIEKNTDLDSDTIGSCLDPTNATTYLK